MKLSLPALAVNGTLIVVAGLTLFPLRLDGVGVPDVARGGEFVSAAAVAHPCDARELPRAILSRAHGPELLEQSRHRKRGHAAVTDVQCERRLCICQVAVSGPRAHSADHGRRARDTGPSRDASAVPDVEDDGLVNTPAGVLVPWLAGVFSIFLVRQHAATVPDEILEAARLDGAGEIRIFLQIVLPLLTPILATLAVFTFLGAWNDFMWPLIVLNDGNLYTLPVALASLSREHVQDSEMMMAGSVVTVLPVLILFLVLQRFYLQGMTSGAVKA